MEGMGSRQSRASSRYASGPSPPVFSGRVRKWKKQWVSSPAAGISKGGKRSEAPPLLLRRWTPLSAAADDPPTRRFRYTPIVPIVKGKMKSVEDEGAMLEKTVSNSKEESEVQEVNEDQAETDSNKTQDLVEM